MSRSVPYSAFAAAPAVRRFHHFILFTSLFVLACISRAAMAADADAHDNVRLNWGLSSDTDLTTAVWGDFEQSFEHTYMLGGSWGHTLRERWFGWPIELTGNLGVQWFDERGLQSDGYGLNAYIKAHYRWRLPGTRKHVRFGLGEGLSYVSRVPLSEERDFQKKGADIHSEKLMNYVEWSIDMPLRDFSTLDRLIPKRIDEVYVGFFIFHRSSVFGVFAETKGGVNYMGLGIEGRY